MWSATTAQLCDKDWCLNNRSFIQLQQYILTLLHRMLSNSSCARPSGVKHKVLALPWQTVGHIYEHPGQAWRQVPLGNWVSMSMNLQFQQSKIFRKEMKILETLTAMNQRLIFCHLWHFFITSFILKTNFCTGEASNSRYTRASWTASRLCSDVKGKVVANSWARQVLTYVFEELAKPLQLQIILKMLINKLGWYSLQPLVCTALGTDDNLHSHTWYGR